MTTTDSNLWGGRSGHVYLKGRLLAILLSTGGKRVLANAPAKPVKAIEARTYQTRQAQS